MKYLVAGLALMLTPLPAAAQVRNPEPPSGITVVARATARIPVKNVRLTVQVRGDVDESTVLAAMRSAGIDDPVMGPSGSFLNAGSNTQLRGVIHNISSAKLEQIGKAAVAFTVSHPGVTIQSVALAPASGECTPAAENGARAAALESARKKTAAIAAASGIAVGPVTAVDEVGGCPTDDDRADFGNASASFDLARLSYTILISETVTSAISGPGGAQRHPL